MLPASCRTAYSIGKTGLCASTLLWLKSLKWSAIIEPHPQCYCRLAFSHPISDPRKQLAPRSGGQTQLGIYGGFSWILR